MNDVPPLGLAAKERFFFTACFDQDLLCKLANERTAKLKLAMEAGSTDIWEEDPVDELFESAAAHVDLPKGVTAEQLSKVWRIKRLNFSNESPHRSS